MISGYCWNLSWSRLSPGVHGQSRYLNRKCYLPIKVCPIYLEPGFNERVKQFRPDNHRSSDPNQTIFCTLKGKGMLNICSKPFLDFQFEFITSVLGLERNHRERAVNLSLHCVRRAADYSWEHWRLNIQAQHLNMLLLLIYFIDIVWIEVNIQIALCRHAESRLKNRSSQVSWIFSPNPQFFTPSWQLSQFSENIEREGRDKCLTQCRCPRPFAKWLSFCGRRWRMRVREKIAPRTKWGVRVMNNKYIAWRAFGHSKTVLLWQF